MTSEWCRVQLSRYAHQRLPNGFSPLDSCLAWRRQIAVIESDFVQCSVSKREFLCFVERKKTFQYLFQPQRLLFPGLLKPSVFNIMLRERYRPDSLTRNQMKEAVKKIRLSVKRTWKKRIFLHLSLGQRAPISLYSFNGAVLTKDKTTIMATILTTTTIIRQRLFLLHPTPPLPKNEQNVKRRWNDVG